MGKQISILIVDDSEDDVFLAMRQLKSSGYAPVWKRVETEEDYRAALASEPDVILSDMKLPRFSARRAWDLLQEWNPAIPFIVVSGSYSAERELQSFRARVTDVVPKDHLSALGPAVERALAKRTEGRTATDPEAPKAG
jgi:CheY-like chemotaxis protein